MAGIRRLFTRPVRIAVSVVLLVLVGLWTDWPRLWAALAGMDPWLVLLSAGFGVLHAALVAWKYVALTTDTPVQTGFVRLLRIHFIGVFYGLLLPSALARGGVRWLKLTRGGRIGGGLVLAATVFERTAYLLVVVLAAALPLSAWTDPALTGLAERVVPLAVAAAVVLAGVQALFLFPGLSAWASDVLAARLGLGRSERWRRFADGLGAFRPTASARALVLMLSVLGQGCLVLRFFCIFQAMGLDVGLWDAVGIASMVMALQVLPVTLAGIGLREGALAYLLGLLGYGAGAGLLAGLVFLAQMLAYAAAGFALECLDPDDAETPSQG